MDWIWLIEDRNVLTKRCYNALKCIKKVLTNNRIYDNLFTKRGGDETDLLCMDEKIKGGY